MTPAFASSIQQVQDGSWRNRSDLGMVLLFIGVISLTLGTALPQEKKSDPLGESKKELKNQVRLDAFGDPLPEKAIRRLGSNRFHHSDSEPCLILSPDGSQIFTASSEEIRWLDASTGQLQGQMAISVKFVLQIQFRSDGKRLLVGSWLKDEPEKNLPMREEICVWDWSKKKILWNRPFEALTCTYAFSPDGMKILLQSKSGTREILDSETGKTLKKFVGHSSNAIFSPDGKTIAYSYDRDNKVEIRNAESDRLEQSFEHQSYPQRIAFSPDGKFLATALLRNAKLNLDSVICFWDIAKGKMVRTLPTGSESIDFIRFSPDGKWLAAVFSQKSQVRGGRESQQVTKIWEVATGKEQFSFAVPVLLWLSELQFSPDNRKLYRVSRDGFVYVCDLQTGKVLFNPKDFRGGGRSIAESPNRLNLVTVDAEGVLRLWDLSTSRPKRTFPESTDLFQVIRFVDFSADGSHLIAFSSGGTLHWFDWKEGKEVHRRSAVDEISMSSRIALSADRKLIAFFEERKDRLFDASTRKQLRVFDHEKIWVSDLTFSLDGNYLARLSQRAEFRGKEYLSETYMEVFSVESGKQLFKTKIPESDLLNRGRDTIGFTPDGYSIAFKGKKRKIFDFISQKERTPPSDLRIQKLEYSPQGAWLATMEFDGMIRIRDSETEKEILSFRSPTPRISCFVWSADRRSLYSGQMDDTVIQWDLSPSKGESKEISSSKGDSLWEELASKDPKVVYRAYWQILTAKNAVSFLQERLKPDNDEVDKQIAQWIEDLTSDQFSIREKASQELQKLGSRCVHALEQPRRTSDSADLIQRIDKLLANLETPKPDYRLLRSLEILEGINTAEAIELLKILSKGNPNADTTQRTISALKRLGQ
jgi:WD40 repeat protein